MQQTQTNASTSPNTKHPGPSTPNAQQAPNSAPVISTPSPGRWRHPRFDEIIRRQKASSFDETNVRRIVLNSGALIALILLRNFFKAPLGFISYFLSTTNLSYARVFLFYFTLLPILNILLELYPLYKGKDNVDDIPLTPSQRALLGLDPNATPPPTPGSTYITPPRYSRSPTPRNSSPASGSQHSRDSPYSRHESPISSSRNEPASSLWGKQGFESPFSPNTSPLLYKAIGNGNRRQSYGSPSPLGPGADRVTGRESFLVGPATPSPSTGRGAASVGLNNRWLYERGRIGSGRKLG